MEIWRGVGVMSELTGLFIGYFILLIAFLSAMFTLTVKTLQGIDRRLGRMIEILEGKDVR